jgi:tRNA (cytidine/uridine-2'-O-)-methyltransferase
MDEKKFHVVLYQPVIPQNTGSIARLCACTGAVLHLIHPLGFRTDAASVKRAGLDYWPHVDVREHPDWGAFVAAQRPESLFFFSKFATAPFAEARFPEGAYLVFGSETKGLPESLRGDYPGAFWRVPMRTHLVRSLNLSQCAAVVLYEALRQHAYVGIESSPPA